ncbi:MAG TPA: HYR domain-containing protein, partial [Candidatus Limnocylindria bacterium]
MVWGRLGAGCALIGILAIAIAVFMVGDASAITDATAPSLTLPASATTNATSSQGATVAFIAVATDDIQPTSITCAPASGSLFPVGTTNVTCVAADAAGHTATASFSVTVVGAAEQLAQLRTAVLAAGLPRGTQTALLAHLDAAQR